MKTSGFRRMLACAIACLVSTGCVTALDGPVLVFGGTAGVGLETVRVLRSRDVPVTVFVRPTSDRASLEPLGVAYAVGNVLNAEEVAAAFDGGKFTAVISSLGGRTGEPRPEGVGNVNIDDAARRAGVRRVIQVSNMGTTRNRGRARPPEDAHWSERMAYAKIVGENHLMASGLDWTILRPGLLRDGSPTGNAWLTERIDVAGSINRSDVARVIVGLLADERTIGRAYSVIDKNMERPFEATK